VAWQDETIPRRKLRMVSFVFLAAMCFLVFAFGLSSE
jgi:hypothetical protein